MLNGFDPVSDTMDRRVMFEVRESGSTRTNSMTEIAQAVKIMAMTRRRPLTTASRHRLRNDGDILRYSLAGESFGHKYTELISSRKSLKYDIVCSFSPIRFLCTLIYRINSKIQTKYS